MKNNLKKKRYLLLSVCILLIVALAFGGYWWFCIPRIHFTHDPITLEVKQDYQAKDFIASIDNASLQDVTMKNTLNTDQLGKHMLTYSVKGRSYSLTYIVKDTKKPVVVTQDKKITINKKPEAKSFIKSIKDATKTTVRYAKPYDFATLGKQKIELIIEDEGKNQTTAYATATIMEKDTRAPIISGMHDLTIIKGEKVDLRKGVKAEDARDGKVSFTVDQGNFDNQQPGRYTITYYAKDNSGNKAKATRSVIVQEKTTGKVIYLTIDDGPSANTPKILDILDKYHVKATFFVTAQCPAYLSYIKTAYQKGHAIGLHTYSHDYDALYASEAAYFQDLQKINEVVKAQTGVNSTIIRFPGGSSNTVSSGVPGLMTRLSKAVQEKGYQYYDWNAESGDGNSALPASTLIQEARSFGGGSPLMMLTHDHPGSGASVEALPSIIEYYQSLGYTFKTIDSSVSGFHHGINN